MSNLRSQGRRGMRPGTVGARDQQPAAGQLLFKDISDNAGMSAPRQFGRSQVHGQPTPDQAAPDRRVVFPASPPTGETSAVAHLWASGIDRRSADGVPMLLTVPQVEAALQLGRTRTYELLRSGGLPVLRFGRMVRVPRAALEVWIAQHSSGGSADRS
jgi:excisionase family DNA binding protein